MSWWVESWNCGFLMHRSAWRGVCGSMSGLVCCRRERLLDDTKPNNTAFSCFVLGVAIVKGGGISRRLSLFNLKKCETQSSSCAVL